jgi:oligogalacturonide transport system ATP-binding protein
MGDRICVMKDGHIMQVADPATLYERPDNAFVAGFIGMPEMNLVPVTLTWDGAPQLTLHGQNVAVPDGLGHRIKREDGPVTLGVRPQHVEVVPEGTRGAFAGVVTHLEYMGHEVNLHARVGEATIVAVVPSEKFDKGLVKADRVGLRPLGPRIQVFNAETGENISLGASGH